MGASRVVRIAGLVVLLVAASAIGPLAWGRLQGAFGVTASVKPVVVPITPFRLVDTRPASEDPVLGGPDEPIGQGETRTYQAAGVQTVPADAIGVVVNVTALDASAPSFLTVFPAGASIPATSTLNPAPGATVFNSATVLLGGGKFSVFHNAGSVHMIIDVVGYLQDHNHDERYLEQNQPIVVTEPASGFERFLSATVPTTVISVGHLYAASGDGIIGMGLTAPTSVGGTQYRLSSVEWCLAANTANAGFVTAAVVYHDQPGVSGSPLAVAVSDQTDRSTTGCYTLTVPALSPRGYTFALGLTGQTTSLTSAAALVSDVKATWVPVTGAADQVGGEGAEDPLGAADQLGALLGS
jgi:hypothetical protein